MKKRKKMIVNYRQNWSEDGTHYTQTIHINKDFIKYINKLIRHYHKDSEENQEITAESVGFSTYYDCYLKEIDTSKNYYFTNITQLQFIYYYLFINNYDVKKIKRRNTMLLLEG